MNVRVYFKSGGYTEWRIPNWSHLDYLGDIKTEEVL